MITKTEIYPFSKVPPTEAAFHMHAGGFILLKFYSNLASEQNSKPFLSLNSNAHVSRPDSGSAAADGFASP
jgi:hypothetical protein